MKIVAAFDDITLNLHIFICEIGRRRIIGIDTPYLCRGKNDHIRPFRLKKCPDLFLTRQVQFLMCSADDIVIPFFPEISDNRASDQSSVSRHINFIRLFHIYNHVLSLFLIYSAYWKPSSMPVPRRRIRASAGDDGKLSYPTRSPSTGQ